MSDHFDRALALKLATVCSSTANFTDARLARMMLRKGHWAAAHTHYSGYTVLQIKPLVSLMCMTSLLPEIADNGALKP
ncbi:hypothetical protein CONLIGDRAFT_687312 [Coniochaeta ligniaria NRRL 30616]|uniref:Cyclin C-terminal domain-containing protein n=1 Tax=Coniochaeta ligniaria NRRL 30616 TaxID=1408157 RepID=A0A1J7INH0_9PEZI|nr:hypothetical protein CONLIGDRAFT_687312 [Coniochaeta ligniaria NRRL 30616]